MKKNNNIIQHYPLSKSLKAYTSHRERAFQTHASRIQVLNRAIQDVYEMGYKINDVKQLKPKHIISLVEDWKEKGISTGEIKNRMSHLRWLAEKIDKQNIIPRTNRELGIEDRKMPSNDINRAVSRTQEDLAKLDNSNVRMSLRAQELFGLRRKESILFHPKLDYDRSTSTLRIETGTKGGRPRVIPVRTIEQRQYLEEAIRYQKEHDQTAFIPKDKTYVDQKNIYEAQCTKYGFHNNHGLRHQYAQERYFDLTGWDCPRRGGMSQISMTEHQLELDAVAREIISNELGHNRLEVTKVYLGK